MLLVTMDNVHPLILVRCDHCRSEKAQSGRCATMSNVSRRSQHGDKLNLRDESAISRMLSLTG